MPRTACCSRSATSASPTRPARAKWSFNHVLFPRPGLTLKRPQGRHGPERYTHGGLSLAECMIPIIVLGPKVKFEPAFDLVGIRFEGVLSEGQPLDILITARAKTAGQGRSAVPATGGGRPG